jgi:hypothetical protein
MTLSLNTVEALRELQQIVGEANNAKGFHEDAPNRDDFVPGERGDRAYSNALNHYHGNLHMLLVSEAVEAHDEIRNGRRADESYYPAPALPSSLVAEVGVARAQELVEERSAGKPRKPEGVPSEIADGVIRAFDYAYRSGFDLAGMIAEKLTYNTTRPYKHGKKF